MAHLAALAPPLSRPKHAVKRAWEIWKEAELEIIEHDNRVAYLRSLFWSPNRKYIPIFTDTPEEWQARFKDYPGEESDVERAMWNKEFAVEEVKKQFYRDNNINRDTQQKLFLGLAKAAIHYDMAGPLVSGQRRLEYLQSVDGCFIDPPEGFPIHPKNRELAKNHFNTICRGHGKILTPKKEVDFVNTIQALLSKPKLNANLVRWAVEVRQKQVSENKSR